MYAVSYIKNAAEYIAGITDSRKKNAGKKPELTDEYIRLFEVMAHSDGLQQPGWAYCFNNGELQLLAEYIFMDVTRGSAEIYAMLSPYRHSDNMDNVDVLYGLWQNHYNNANYIHIFNMINESDVLRMYFDKKYGVNTLELSGCIADGKAAEYFNRIAGRDSGGDYGAYCMRLNKAGLDEQSTLYRKCVNIYALVCDGKAYMKMGIDTVKDFMDKLCDDDRIVMMQNMLRVLDSFQLKKFVSLYPLFREYAGDNYSGQYKDIIAPLPEGIKKKYKLWENQYYIYSVLGNGEKADFWMGYADKGTCTKHGHADVLFLCFDGFTVIEFTHVDAAYFFNSIYFSENIEPHICLLQTENEVEEWIYGNAEWSLDKTHQDHWRKAHVGSWQLDMKSYMSRNLVKVGS